MLQLALLQPGRISWVWWTGIAKSETNIFTINSHNHNGVVFLYINKSLLPQFLGRVADGPKFGNYTT